MLAKKKEIPALVPKNFVELLEKGKTIYVAKEAGKALVKSDPENYKWPKGKKPKDDKEPEPVEDLEPETTETPDPEPSPDHKSDGKFTLEDIEALPHKEKVALAKKLKISAKGSGKELAQRIFDAAG